jgi:hypothetical protein
MKRFTIREFTIKDIARIIKIQSAISKKMLLLPGLKELKPTLEKIVWLDLLLLRVERLLVS